LPVVAAGPFFTAAAILAFSRTMVPLDRFNLLKAAAFRGDLFSQDAFYHQAL
jgi:hypothetical protein